MAVFKSLRGVLQVFKKELYFVCCFKSCSKAVTFLSCGSKLALCN
jgi:hypothetical protein